MKISNGVKKIDIFLLIGGLAILITIGFLVFIDKFIPSDSQEKTEISSLEVKEKVSLTIDYGEGETDSFESDFKEGITAFDLLKEGAENLNLALETKTYDIGIFIEAIGDKENGQDGKYWLYYINSKMPMVSADNQKLKPGDKVEFKFEKSTF